MSFRQVKITHSITNRDTQSLKKYLQEIGTLKLITAEEETNLAVLIQNGSKESLDRLVIANLRFVVSVAKHYQHMGLSLADLISEGNIGLMKAAGSFDHTRGFKFISYAVWWIRQSMLQAITTNARIVRLPLNKEMIKNNIQRAGSMLEQKLERTASVEELAEELNTNSREVADLLGMSDRHLSLDAPLTVDGEESMLDILESPNADSTDKEVNYTASLNVEIVRLLEVLNERQKETICGLFGIAVDRPMSIDEIADRYNLTTERIRQIKDKALEKLRTCGNLNLLRSFLGG